MERVYKALLIGNATYSAESGLPALNGPQNDIFAMRDALVHPEHGLFDPANVARVAEQKSHVIKNRMEAFFRGAGRDDVLLLYFSGHGRLDEGGELLLCAQETELDLLLSTTVASGWLNAMIEVSVAAAIVIILDCCHSGAFKGAPDIVSPIVPPDGRGRYVLAACRARELAADAIGPRHLSPFTHHVVAGLTGQLDKTDEDGFVSMDDLSRYVHSEMRTTSRQTPTHRATCEGSIRIARSATRRPPLSVAPKVIHLVDVEAGEELPVERVRVRGLLAGDFWTATTEVDWIQITRLAEQVELRLTAQPVKSRANVEIVNNDTGEIRVVRVVLRPAAATPSGDKLKSTMYDLLRAAGATPPAAQEPAAHLIEQFVKRVPGARQAILVNYDGMVMAASGPMGRDDLDRLAAGVSGLRHTAWHLAALADGELRCLLADLDAGIVAAVPVDSERTVALYATPDVANPAFELTVLAETLRAALPKPQRPPAEARMKDPPRPVRTDLSHLLDSLAERSGEVLGCLVASVDGIAVATDRDFPYSAGHAAAVSCSLFGSCRGVSTQLNAGAVRQVVVDTGSGYRMVTPVGNGALLAQFLTSEADIGVNSYEAVQWRRRIGGHFG